MKKHTPPAGLRSYRRFSQLRLLDYEYDPGERTDFHKDRIPRISILLRGQLQERLQTQEAWASPMSVVIKPADALHANQFGPGGARIISIIAPNGWPDYLAEHFLNQYAWFHGRPTISAASDFLQELVDLKNESQLETALIQLVAGLSEEQSPHKDPPSWLQRVAEQLEDQYDETIQIRQLAAASDVHPVYLARIFRRYFHCNPKQYQSHFRLRRALDHLTQQKPLVHVALDNGFADQSHFTRLFKSSIGMSPGSFRKLVFRIQQS
ncbi:helix-turn-helix domain-containing protein [Flavilitoribacter nigricans]|uniref:HTH araC/xylS-type domain-containing protein n=1 Tax=Flavilitoribacter nigricans (strain ATCC 23147 / DSM 23189 / NBRC 102662 / NCIMB 1420 / SS-2) TaxID=1122177 RepID=A0A2D0NF72_FLAN2|nr:AraC family transcriptional regulator [Flavilitoribacter nigricans]PHN07161.1 hypothetical protein CRP01_08015 [Flavilitoribacter nigricans DSM 23189 = NBRC 102662]